MRTISQRDLRNDSGQVLRELREGEEFEVKVNGVSVGVLRMDPPPGQPQRFVDAEQWNAALRAQPQLSEDERRAWKGDIAAAADDPADDPYERA